jgi:hypothetical protein
MPTTKPRTRSPTAASPSADPVAGEDAVGRPIESVPAEIAAGDMLTTSELARRQHTSPSTVFRWLDKGLPDGRGGRVFLEAVRRGKNWLTSSAAVRRFFERLEQSAPLGPAIRTPAKRDRECARAEKRLRDRGVNF